MGKNLKICALILSAIMLLSMLAGCVVANNAEAEDMKVDLQSYSGIRIYQDVLSSIQYGFLDSIVLAKTVDYFEKGIEYQEISLDEMFEKIDDNETEDLLKNFTVLFTPQDDAPVLEYCIRNDLIFKSYQDHLFVAVNKTRSAREAFAFYEELLGIEFPELHEERGGIFCEEN